MKDTSVLEMWQEWSHVTRLSSADPCRPVCSSRDVPVGKRAIVKLTGKSLTGCNEVPTVVFKTGSIYSTCDSLIVTGSLNGRGCDITIDTGSNISIMRADVLTNAKRYRIQPVRSCLRTVTGEKAPIHGKGAVHLRVGNLTMTHQMWVADIYRMNVFWD